MNANVIPDPVIDGITDDGPKDNRNKEPSYIKHPAGCGCTTNKEQRISRQEREYNKTRFKKNDKEQDEVCPDTIFLDYRDHILVKMKENSYQRIYHGFWKLCARFLY